MFVQGNWLQRRWRNEKPNSGQRLEAAGSHCQHYCWKQGENMFLYQLIQRSWHPVSLTLRSQNHGVGRCSYCQPQGREWKRNTLVSSFPFSLLQPGSPLTSSRHKPAKRSSPWDMEQDRGRVKIDPEDTWAQALHVWPHSQAILREISPLILCSPTEPYSSLLITPQVLFFSIK